MLGGRRRRRGEHGRGRPRHRCLTPAGGHRGLGQLRRPRHRWRRGTADDGAGGGGGGWFGGGGGGAGRLFTNPVCWGHPGGGGGGSSYVGPGGTGISTGSAGANPARVVLRYQQPDSPPSAKAATALQLEAKPKRDRKAPYAYRVRGRVDGVFPADAIRCQGTVRLTVKKGGRTLKKATTALSADCTFAKRVKVTRAKLGTGKRTKLTIKVRFPGNPALEPSTGTLPVRAN
ncbi:hypothetical protein [Nocardioides humi]|uniref:hypothetical protein n=1 Tax=Nocardioides humi TaxID=449461 RepID=UPI001FE909E5|nr:hypothetical protein [Nocardioides humi]